MKWFTHNFIPHTSKVYGYNSYCICEYCGVIILWPHNKLNRLNEFDAWPNVSNTYNNNQTLNLRLNKTCDEYIIKKLLE